ncbi:SH3 domain-containing kinase-binding protein 1 [Anoplophora glabripennis]|uniref:SH3 domain-containing kinase-binding protein 1 n=1 Tax=Anoplophora glabripennis TaxID=217634 RepID=UPI000874264B|nr:SH3 domain-containing kinase-binding protein 1 [Anoplophora glabripennis]
MEVIVEYDYTAKEPDELTIKKGDIIKDVVKKQGGWWEGVLKDKKGMFPDNFVRALDKDSSVILRNKKDVSRIRQCRVVFSYNQDHEDELNLNVGDVINIIGEEEEGWWRGVLNGKQGVFPSNFVEEIVLQLPHPKPSTREDITSIAGDADLKVPKLPIKPSKQLCEVKFPYKAQNEDELSLKEGDVITLINKDSQDPGWWTGELNGKIGVFPDNFVSLISSTDDKSSYKEENKSSAETGAIKPSSIALQRKSLEGKNDKVNGDPNITTNKTPPPPGKKPLVPIKKSPSVSGIGLFSEIKKKLVDVVDGATGSKSVIIKAEASETKSSSSDNAFDQIERRSLLTDVRATRVKAPGRRLPTAIHKDEDNTVINGNAEHISESDVHSSNTAESDSFEKRRVREWEKHKAPWLEEMKLNQAKRTSTSPGPENKLKLTPTADGNSEMEESNSDKSVEKQSDLSKSMPPMDLSKSLSSTGNKPKITNEMDKAPIVREKPNLPSVSINRQSLPINIKDNPVANRTILNATAVIKDSPAAKPPKVPQISPVTNRNSAPQKPSVEKPNEVVINSENHDVSHKQYSQLLERLQKLEIIVENQKHAIEDLRNKLQIETDMRMMLQEKVLQKL